MGWYIWADSVLLFVLFTIFFYPTRQHAYRVAILAAMICALQPIYLTLKVSDSLVTTHGVGGFFAYCIGLMVHLVFSEGPFPDHWRRVVDEVGAAGDVDNRPSNFPFTKKLWWMLNISRNSRMIGWVQEPRSGIPPHPPPSRRLFFWTASYKLIKNFVVADIAISLMAMSPAFDYRVHDPNDGPETYLNAVPFLRRVPYVLLFGIRTETGAGVMHNAMSLLFVGLGSSPTLWPDNWGRWGDAYTVRKLWGHTWHQSSRPTFTGLGRIVANKILKFPRGTNRSSYTQLYVAFIYSGLCHAAGWPFHFSSASVVEKRLVYRTMEFFLLQAVAITFEDFVIYLAKGLLRRWKIELKPGKDDEGWAGVVVRIIGYCWVTLWFCFSLPIWLDVQSPVEAVDVMYVPYGTLSPLPLSEDYAHRASYFSI